MKLLLLPLLVTALAQAGDDAEKRFKMMEEKITRAAAFQVTFDGKMEGGMGNTGAFKGTLTVGPNGKARLTANADFMGKTAKLEMVSDGKKLKMDAEGKPEPSRDQPKDWRTTLNVITARTGLTAGMLLIGRSSRDEGEGPFATMKLSDFELLKGEKVNGRAAVVLKYKLTPKDKTPAVCTVWLDAQTNLPLKRTLYINEGGGVTLSETYSNFNLNPRLDDKMFELPK